MSFLTSSLGGAVSGGLSGGAVGAAGGLLGGMFSFGMDEWNNSIAEEKKAKLEHEARLHNNAVTKAMINQQQSAYKDSGVQRVSANVIQGQARAQRMQADMRYV